MDRFGPTGKVSKKLVHLLRWSSFRGRTGLNFGAYIVPIIRVQENTSRNRRRAISRMVITQINGLPQGTPSYKSSSVRRFKNVPNTRLWSTQHPGTSIRAMLTVHPLPTIFPGLFS